MKSCIAILAPDRCAGSGINMQPSPTARFRVSSSAAAIAAVGFASSSAIIGVGDSMPPGQLGATVRGTRGRDGFEGVRHLHREWALRAQHQTLCGSERDGLVRSY